MERLEDFRVLRELGRGAMGVVYEAIEEPLGRRVALKVIRSDFGVTADSAARFLSEARAVAALEHPNIVTVYRFGTSNGITYIALEYVDGTPLDKLLATERLSPGRSVEILLGVSSALGHAHRIGIVHRDVKPGNVLVTKDGRPILGDFGIAKRLSIDASALTMDGSVIGTPAYMSPEQALSTPVSPATDVYSLGIVAYELFTGRVPFTADSALSLLMKHVQEPAPALEVSGIPRALADLVRRMLAKSPEERPKDAGEVHAALSSLHRSLTEPDAPTMLSTGPIQRVDPSRLEEIELTAACFELVAFSRGACQDLLPARAAFLLESWYRLARQAIQDGGGTVDRYVADKVTALFGYPVRSTDHTRRALATAAALSKALADFNAVHDLHLKMRAGIACGTALVGHIAGDVSETSAQGSLMCDMGYLSKTRSVDAPFRLNRTAYRRVSDLADFTKVDDPRAGEIWIANEVKT